METQNVSKEMLNHDESSRARGGAPRRQPPGRRLVSLLLGVPLLIGASLSTARAQSAGGGVGVPTPVHLQGGDVADDGRDGHRGGVVRRVEKMMSAIGATDAQKAQVKTIWEGLRPQLKAIHQEHGQLRRQIADALAAPSIDANRVEQLRKQAVQTMDRLSTVMTQGLVATGNVLTPEQRKAALQKFEERRGRGRFFGPPSMGESR